MAEIQAVHAKSRASYGSPRIQAALKKGGMCLSRKRVAGLMKRLGLHGSQKRRFRPVTTESHHDYPVSENRLRSLESVERPDQVWVSDITYIQTAGRWSYLAVVMDLFNREVKGWSLEFHLRSELIQAAFQKACYRYEPGEGILFHSDRGCQYASTAFRQMLERKGFISSMSRKGNCYDNAALESFWSTLKAEVVPSKGFESLAQARLVLFDYIECFYNRSRLHSSLGYQSPVEYEQCYYRQFTLAGVSTKSGQVQL